MNFKPGSVILCYAETIKIIIKLLPENKNIIATYLVYSKHKLGFYASHTFSDMIKEIL